MMAGLLSIRELEGLEDGDEPALPVGAFARDRAAADKRETDVLPKGYLFGAL